LISEGKVTALIMRLIFLDMV